MRWLAAASLFLEDTLRRIPGYRDLPTLQAALQLRAREQPAS